MLGLLHTFRRRQGLPSETDVEVPAAGIPARQLALSLGLPLEAIEAAIVNRRARPLSWTVRPGDRVAFVPRGTPGPHRYTLGIYSAGRKPEK